jgi:hypothetical protein
MASSFNGTSSYIEVNSTPVTGPPFTMASWVYSTNNTLGQVLMSVGNNATANRFQLAVQGDVASDPVSFTIVGSTTESLQYIPTVPYINRWVHVAGVVSGVSSKALFVDGIFRTSVATSAAPAGVNNILIGSRWSAGSRGSFLAGRTAETAIWNKALNGDQIFSLYRGYSPYLVASSGLVFFNRSIRDNKDIAGGRTVVSNVITPIDHPRIYG